MTTEDTDTEAADTEPQAAPEPADPVDSSATADSGADATDDSGKLRKEAARYRRSLRDTEAERDSLRDRLTTLQRAEVERIATADDGLARADDLWLSGLDLASLLDDDGNVDAGKVRQTVAKVLDDRPHWRRAAPVAFDGGARQPAPAGVSMQQVLQGKRR
jgi:hypothetical protein